MQKAIRSGVSESYLANDLKQLDRWLCWQAEESDANTLKVPVNRDDSGNWYRVSYRNSDNHYTYQQATKLYEQCRDNAGDARVDGRQVVIKHGVDDFIIVDLDNCVDPETGIIDEWAQAYVTRAGTYTELSPSGEGLHLIFRNRVERQGWAGEDDDLEGEVYKKYIITFTGDHIVGTPFMARSNPEFLEQLFSENDIWWRDQLYETQEDDQVYGAPTLGAATG